MAKIDCKKEKQSIDSVSTLLSIINELKKARDISKIWYRGLKDESYKLLPGIGRKLLSKRELDQWPYQYNGKYIDKLLNMEENLLHRFRRHACSYLGKVLSEWDALLLAQHYALPTRLMDWTANPLIGLFFACKDGLKKNAKLWAITRIKKNCNDINIIDTNIKSPFKYYRKNTIAVKIIHPFYNSTRIVAQDGIFTYHSHPGESLESFTINRRKFKKENLDIKYLIGWDIPWHKKAKIIEELDGLGINERTVYPDIEHLSIGLYHREILWNGKKINIS